MQQADIAAENHKLQDKMRTLQEANQRSVRALEVKVQSLQDELEVNKTELTSTQSEYESYKVRKQMESIKMIPD